MASVLALLDAVAFKKYAKRFSPGAVLPIEAYQTTERSFATELSYGGALYLAVADARGTLWLVAVLEAPETSGIKKSDKRKPGWYAATNTTPVTALTPLRKQLELGRDPSTSLAEPRVLTAPQDAAIRELLDAVDAPVMVQAEAMAKAPALDASLPPLERALRYLGGGALEQAIAAISEAWRTSRAPQLADLVDRVARLMPASSRPLFDKRVSVDSEEASAVWNTAFDADPQAAMPQLLLNLGVGGSDEIPRRVERLSTLPLDPRFGARVIELFSMRSSTSYDDDSDAAWWQPVASLLSRSADARTFASILELESTGEAVGGTGTQLYAMAKKSTPTLPTADKPWVAKIEAELERREEPYRTECALVDQIAANPDDDDPYLVYADWLIEQGRPHGELIALSCQQRGSKLTPAKVRRLTQLSELPYLCGQFDDAPATRLRKRERGVDRELDVYWSMQPRSWRLLATSPLIRAITRIKLVGSPVPGRAEAIAELIEAAPALQRIDDIGLTTAKQVMKRVDTFEYLAPKLTRAQRASAAYDGRSVEVYLQRKR